MHIPSLIVVTGMPAAGKSTIAEALARSLGLPLIAKDEIKERLYDALGTGDVDWSQRLGEAAYELIFSFSRVILLSGNSGIAEANFFRGSEERFSALPEHRLVQIHCAAPLEILVARYAGRVRHPGHNDREKVAGLAARLESGLHTPLSLPGVLIELETSQPVDHDLLAERIRVQL